MYLEGEVVPEGEIWVGNPAVFVRRITEEERDHNKDLCFQYSKVAEVIGEEMNRPIEEQMFLEELKARTVDRDECLDDYRAIEKARNEGLPYADEDFSNSKRLFDIEEKHDLENLFKNQKMSEDYPYNYDEFPRNFNTHKSNYRVHNELKGRVDTDSEIQRPDYRVLEKEGELNKPDNWTRKY